MANTRVDVHEKALSLPAKPGVYLMLDSDRKVIYVGKAKKLVNRVSSYFRENPNHNYKTRVMVSRVWDFDWIVTDTEFEALVLENSLIKRYLPKYNILLKDDKGYPFIRVDLETEFPRLTMVSKPGADRARYFGPYSSRNACRQAIAAIQTAVGLPSCNRKFPRDFGKQRPCLNHHLGTCAGVCTGRISREEYAAMLEQAMLVLQGKTGDLTRALEQDMTRHAEAMEFEQAAKLRDKIAALERMCAKQKVMSGFASDTDVIGLCVGTSKTAFAILHYIEGTLLESEIRMIDTPPFADTEELLSGFLKQYYGGRESLPKRVYIPTGIEEQTLLEEWLSGICGERVYLMSAQRGEKKKMLQMAEENARQKVRLSENEEENTKRLSAGLQNLLGLSEPPRRIEAYDISNTAGKQIVGAMVVFRDFRPQKSEYRMFQIKSLADQDDCAAMREMLGRRLRRLLAADERFSRTPDLILLDGGRNQCAAVQQELDDLGLVIPLFGMVKDDRHRTRAIINAQGEEIGIAGNPAVFHMIGNLQEEVHRAAIGYHRKKRGSTISTSGLEKIPGIGAARAKALLRAFGGIRGVKEADLNALGRVIPRDAAQRVYRYYHEQEEK